MPQAIVESDLRSYGSGIEQRKWKGFLFLGFVLLLGGVVSVALPAVSAYASSVVLGAMLMAIGLVKIIQSLRVKNWLGFVWQELTGVVELVGGIMVYFNRPAMTEGHLLTAPDRTSWGAIKAALSGIGKD